MSLRVQCPNRKCGKVLTVPAEQLGHNCRCPMCGQVFHSPQPAWAAVPLPAQIGRYKLRARLGAGTYGTVYRAYDPQLDREVALKVLKTEALDDPQAADRFRREARAAAKLHHTHIVPVYESGADGPHHFIAYGLIDGPSLASVIGPTGLDLRRAIRLTAEVAEALAVAHTHGILHRDVKPANVMLDRADRAHLVDFGLARRLAPDATRLTGLGVLIGTLAYLAPELLGDHALTPTPACDQYSLGATFYHLLTGRPPFDGTPEAILTQILFKDPAPVRDLRPEVPPGLAAICGKAMARKPADRFPECGAFAEILRRWQDDKTLPGGKPAARPTPPAARKAPPPAAAPPRRAWPWWPFGK